MSWKHAVKFIHKKFKTKLNKVVVLPVTSPCREIRDINNCINLFETKKFDSTMVVSKTSLHPAFNLVEKNKNKIQLIDKSKKIYRRQQFKKTFKLTTVAIVTNSNTILKKKYNF